VPRSRCRALADRAAATSQLRQHGQACLMRPLWRYLETAASEHGSSGLGSALGGGGFALGYGREGWLGTWWESEGGRD
jgi:hypothetical protein